MQLKSKDLLGMQQLDKEEIELILNTAQGMKQALLIGHKKTTHLQGKSVVTLFYENSTRTRLSFEMAAKYMGAATGNIAVSGSSINKGETLLDTAVTIDHMATDFIIMRHPSSGAPFYIADRVNASVINAGDGMDEHPTQCLLDLFTMKEQLGTLSGLKVAIIGDIAHSRVARSNIWALNKFNSEVRVAGPASMMPVEFEKTGAIVCNDVKEACEGCDVVMGLRLQLERMHSALFPSVNEYARFYGINDEVMACAQPHAIVMHPGPYNHGMEMTSNLRYSDQSFIDEQVTNGVACRMAVLYLLNVRRNSMAADQ
ncbi:MAG: aspartate carbamoyltransferase catalytic subunit [Fastidiosipilaceae bacterium]|jgi:aspartate carbamoyltransferase catalytic subunit|nr:aspartate carbamoyltransferase catalytic subunit [Clostridiaceae bacterium]